MRAKQNFKIKLLVCCLMVLLLGTLLVACNKYVPDHYDYLVTFCYNLGTKISGNAPNVYLGVLDPEKDGAYVGIWPGYNNSTFSEASVAGYYLENWYLPKLTNGEIVTDDDGKVVLEDEPFDFATKIHEDTTLYAKLLKSPRMLFVDAQTGDTVSEIDGKRPGETRYKPSVSLAPQKTVDGEPYTFMGDYYADPECTDAFEFPYVFGEEDVKVYCKFIKGEWTLVRTVREFNNAVANGQNIYLMDDIDFAEQTYAPSNYNAELNGNGHSIKNITISKTGRYAITKFSKGTNVGVFATLMGRSYIHDVRFENVTIEIESSADYESILSVNIGSLAGEAREGARIEDVIIAGQITCDENTRLAVEKGGITLGKFIGQNNAKAEQIVNCDYSGVN